MKNNFHFGICDKQQSPQDSLALMVATADKYLSRTQSYRLHKYDLSNAWKEYNLQQLVGPLEEYFISYNWFFCKWAFTIWKFTCETHGLHTQVFGFSSKVKSSSIYILPKIFVFPQILETFSENILFSETHFLKWILINITIILHENRDHVPASSTIYSHLPATPGAAYPPRLGLAYLGQYLGHILSKVYYVIE